MNLLATWLIRAAERAPKTLALVAADRACTYGGLKGRIEGIAKRLRRRGLQPGMAVAASMSSAENLALSMYAASRLGCALLPLNPALPADRRAALRQLAGAGEDATMVLAEALAGQDEAGGQEPTPRLENRIELVIATSGTQGEPKGVMLSGGNLQASVLASRSRIPLKEGDAWLVCLPLYHIGGMSILYRCAEAGATAVLHEGFDPLQVWKDMEKYRISHVSLVPAMLARLLDAGRDAPPPATLRYALVGGGPLSSALVRRARHAGWPVCATYGMSETASQVATWCGLPEDWEAGRVGLPLPGLEVGIVDGLGHPTSGIGRIRIRGNAVMAGYANPQRIPGQGLEQGWLVSGDIGQLDEQGCLTVLGRYDDMLVSGGVNVHPLPVEEVLKRCPGVTDAALTAVADNIWGDLLVGLVVGQVSDEVLEKWCRDELSGAMRPRRFIRVQALPRNALGKLERRELPGLIPQNLH